MKQNINLKKLSKFFAVSLVLLGLISFNLESKLQAQDKKISKPVSWSAQDIADLHRVLRGQAISKEMMAGLEIDSSANGVSGYVWKEKTGRNPAEFVVSSFNAREIRLSRASNGELEMDSGKLYWDKDRQQWKGSNAEAVFTAGGDCSDSRSLESGTVRVSPIPFLGSLLGGYLEITVEASLQKYDENCNIVDGERQLYRKTYIRAFTPGDMLAAVEDLHERLPDDVEGIKSDLVDILTTLIDLKTKKTDTRASFLKLGVRPTNADYRKLGRDIDRYDSMLESIQKKLDLLNLHYERFEALENAIQNGGDIKGRFFQKPDLKNYIPRPFIELIEEQFSVQKKFSDDKDNYKKLLDVLTDEYDDVKEAAREAKRLVDRQP